MAKTQLDAIYDDGSLKYLRERVTRVTICSSAPANYTDANSTTGAMLARSDLLTSGSFTLADGDAGGRKITLAQQTLTVDKTGTMKQAAWLGSTGSLIYGVTDITSAALTAGKGVILPVHDFEFGDVAAQAYKDIVAGVQSANLLAYWPMDELTGTNADNYEGTAALDGTYTGVTLNNSTGPFGGPAAKFDGTNDILDIYSTSLNSGFNRDEFTIMVWAKVTAGSQWTDGTQGRLITVNSVSTAQTFITENSNASRNVYYLQNFGTTSDAVVNTTYTGTGWTMFAITRSTASGDFKAYLNGSQDGSTVSGLNTAEGTALSSDNCAVGGNTVSSPVIVWDGWISHVAIWNTPLTSSEITTLYNGGPV